MANVIFMDPQLRMEIISKYKPIFTESNANPGICPKCHKRMEAELPQDPSIGGVGYAYRCRSCRMYMSPTGIMANY